MTPRLLLATPLLSAPRRRPGSWRSRLEAEFPHWRIDEVDAWRAAGTDYPWHEVRAMACLDFPEVEVAALSSLRLVQGVATGSEKLPVAELGAAGVHVCNAAGTAADEIAEFVLARILEDAKRFAAIGRAQADHRWEHLYGEGLRGAELLLVGFGAINRRVAELGVALRMSVRVVRRAPRDDLPAGVLEQQPVGDLPRLAGQARFVVCAVPSTPETDSLMHRGVIDALPTGALLVNVGRGNSVDGPALRAACASGRIRAAVDVFETEPLPADSGWWDTPGLRVSAHCASVPDAALAAVEDLFVDNLHRLEAGAPLRHQLAGPVGVPPRTTPRSGELMSMTNTPSGIEAYQLGRSYDVMPIPMVPEHCVEIPAGPLRFVVEARNLSDEAINLNALERGRPDATYDSGIDDGGACVHVLGAEDGLEWLRFDCFDNEPHYHYVRNAEQANVVVRFDQFAEGDPEAWTLQRLRSHLPAMLAHAGASELAQVVAASDLGPAVDEVAAVLARSAG